MPSNLTVVDVTPLPVGIKVKGDKMDIIIPANANIPIEAEKKYQTSADNQTAIRIDVRQGEHETATMNTSLGVYVFNVEAAPKG